MDCEGLRAMCAHGAFFFDIPSTAFFAWVAVCRLVPRRPGVGKTERVFSPKIS